MSGIIGQETRLPRDLDAERTVLSCILLEPDRLDVAVERLDSEDFFSQANREVFRAMQRLSAKVEPITFLSVLDELRKEGALDSVGGPSYISDLNQWETGASAFEFAIDVVRNKAIQRKLVEVAQGIAENSLSERAEIEELLAESEHAISSIVNQNWKPAYKDLEEIAREIFATVRERMTNQDLAQGVPTGFKDLDNRTLGLHKGNLIILAARPSMGKTALALNIAMNAAKKGRAVVVFSLEMSREELGFRLLSSESGIPSRMMREGRLTRDQIPVFNETVKRVSAYQMIVDDTPALSITEIRARARRLKREGKCEMVVVDYLQLVRASKGIESREQQIADISRNLKALAKELEIPVLALSQLNRSVESRKPPKPQLSDLRESGAIEQDADVIMFIYRDEYYFKDSKEKGTAEIILGKQRSGPVGSVKLAFIADQTMFTDLMQSDDGFGFNG